VGAVEHPDVQPRDERRDTSDDCTERTNAPGLDSADREVLRDEALAGLKNLPARAACSYNERTAHRAPSSAPTARRLLSLWESGRHAVHRTRSARKWIVRRFCPDRPSLEDLMKAATLIGALLIVLGIGALAYQGFTYTSEETILDIGPIEATQETTKTIPLPPVVGALALVGGIVLVVTGARGVRLAT
jgi:hypothetical protein